MTAVNSTQSSVLRIGAWRVDPALDEISQNGTVVKLEPRTMRLLICLAERAGQVVSVEQLLEEVWKEVIVTPDSVYHAVAALRRVLGDDTKEPTYIANVLRRGYRLIAPVSPWIEPRASPSDVGADVGPERAAAPPAATPVQPRVRRLSRRGALTLLVAGALLAGGYWLAHRLLSAVHGAAASAVEPGATRETSVAVLPFLDLSETKDQQYFADGLTEELIERLGQGRLHVAARSSSFYFRGKQATTAEIARTLGVGYLLEGSVRKAGDALRVTAYLVRAADGYDVWSQTYNRSLADVLQVQDEIASAVVQQFQLSILAPEHTFTSNADAHDEYFRALTDTHHGSASDYDAAEAHLHTALTLDPQFAAAWALLAMATIWKFEGRAPGPTAEACASARVAADRALGLNAVLAQTHRAKGIVLHSCDRDLKAAASEYDRALALHPDDSLVLMSQAWLALDMEQNDRALEFARRATAMDPLNPWTFAVLGEVSLDAGHPAEAEAAARKAIAIDPSLAFIHGHLAIALLTNHKPAEAAAEAERENDPQYRLMLLPIALDAAGRRRDAERAVQELRLRYGEQNADWVALYYACGHNADAAVQWLRTYAARHTELTPYRPYLRTCLNSLESDPRYQALRQQLRFATQE